MYFSVQFAGKAINPVCLLPNRTGGGSGIWILEVVGDQNAVANPITRAASAVAKVEKIRTFNDFISPWSSMDFLYTYFSGSNCSMRGISGE